MPIWIERLNSAAGESFKPKSFLIVPVETFNLNDKTRFSRFPTTAGHSIFVSYSLSLWWGWKKNRDEYKRKSFSRKEETKERKKKSAKSVKMSLLILLSY